MNKAEQTKKTRENIDSNLHVRLQTHEISIEVNRYVVTRWYETFFHLVSIGAMYVVDVGVGEDMAWSSVAKTHCASRYRQKGRLSNWIYSLNECRFRRAGYGRDKWRAHRTLRCLYERIPLRVESVAGNCQWQRYELDRGEREKTDSICIRSYLVEIKDDWILQVLHQMFFDTFQDIFILETFCTSIIII